MISDLDVPARGQSASTIRIGMFILKGIRMESSVPSPGRESICSVPPMAVTRSALQLVLSPCGLVSHELGWSRNPRRRPDRTARTRFSLHARNPDIARLACLTALVSAS